jgi:hypothetical protein
VPVAGIWARIVAEKAGETDVTTTGSGTRGIWSPPHRRSETRRLDVKFVTRESDELR